MTRPRPRAPFAALALAVAMALAAPAALGGAPAAAVVPLAVDVDTAPGTGSAGNAAGGPASVAVESSTRPRSIATVATKPGGPASAAPSTATATSAPVAGPAAPASAPAAAAAPDAGATPAVAYAGPPADAVEVCDKFGSDPVADGKYFVQNNQWGADSPQCVAAWDVGFEVTKADHHSSGGVPAAYPALVAGCHYGNCTKDTLMPRPVAGVSELTSDWSVVVPDDGEWNVAYDIWFDPTARRDGTATGLELMIWLDKQGPQQPLGSRTATANIGGAEWEVWTGDNGTPVISYVRTEAAHSVTGLDLMAFAADATERDMIQPDWYLTSVQAGFEPVVGGRGRRRGRVRGRGRAGLVECERRRRQAPAPAAANRTDRVPVG